MYINSSLYTGLHSKEKNKKVEYGSSKSPQKLNIKSVIKVVFIAGITHPL